MIRTSHSRARRERFSKHHFPEISVTLKINVLPAFNNQHTFIFLLHNFWILSNCTALDTYVNPLAGFLSNMFQREQSHQMLLLQASRLRVNKFAVRRARRCQRGLGPIYTWRRICQRILNEVSTNSRRILDEEFFAGEEFFFLNKFLKNKILRKQTYKVIKTGVSQKILK